MGSELEILRFEQEWRAGSRDVAKQIAKHYVDQRRKELSPLLASKTLQELVQLIDSYRAAGQEADRIIVDMWLLSEYKPQRIVGSMNIGGAAAVAQAEAIIRKENESGE